MQKKKGKKEGEMNMLNVIKKAVLFLAPHKSVQCGSHKSVQCGSHKSVQCGLKSNS